MTIKAPTIIACLDTTSASDITLRYACLQAKKLDFAVQILAVMESSYKGLLFASKTVGKEKRSNVEKRIKKSIDNVYKETGVMPSVSIREGEITREIINEIRATPSCAMLVLGKSYNSLSDNSVLPKLSSKIGNKIRVPVVIIPENISAADLNKIWL
jgi:nucleotide-binding universal stress UspA family protein